MLKGALRVLASLQLAVLLLGTLATVLACATVLEIHQGREYTQWYVYKSSWFIGLLGLLALNVLAATLIRFPWKRRQLGFVVTHAGLLFLLAGSLQTLVGGLEGRIALREGTHTDRMVATGRSLIRVSHVTTEGRCSKEFAVRPGPVDWPDTRHLDLGRVDDLTVRIRRFHRHAVRRTAWVADESASALPAIQLVLCGPGDRPVDEQWLAGNYFGSQVVVGPTMYELLPLPLESMAADFLSPPTDNLGEAGVLSIHCEERMQRVRVVDTVGKKVPVGDSGIEVELVEYLPNARPTRNGRFVSKGDQPGNPLLELLVYLPDGGRPERQIAFARLPLMNLDGVRGHGLPVKFWYHHVAASVNANTVFFHTPTGKLYCRQPSVGGGVEPVWEAKQGDCIPLANGFAVTIQRYLCHAREDLTFLPAEHVVGNDSDEEAAALLEIAKDNTRHRVWLKRNDERDGIRVLNVPDGKLMAEFDYVELPLGFRLELQNFERHTNPGRGGDAAFVSRVRLTDARRGVDEQRTIAANQPLAHGKYRIYQSGFEELPGRMQVAVFTAAHDPGRSLKYVGCLLLCAGIFIIFYLRAYPFRNLPSLQLRRPARSRAEAALKRKSAAADDRAAAA